MTSPSHPPSVDAAPPDARRRAAVRSGAAVGRPPPPRELAGAQECLDLLDRGGPALAGCAPRDLDAAGRQRARRHRQDPGHAEELGIGELDAGRLVASSYRISRPASAASACEPLRGLEHLRVLARADRRRGARDTARPRPARRCPSRRGAPRRCRRRSDRARCRTSPSRSGGARHPRRGTSTPNASVKSVPSLKMLPTSMPLRSLTGEPHAGHGSPSRAFGDVGDQVRRVVARHVDVPDVPADAVRAGHEVRRAGDQLVDDDDRVAGPDRRAVAGLHAARLDLLDCRRPEPAARLERVRRASSR